MFFFNQKTAYEMRISDWSSDVCSSDLLDHPDFLAPGHRAPPLRQEAALAALRDPRPSLDEIGRQGGGADCYDRRCGRRSAERRVGKACVSTCRHRWSPYT